MLYKRDPKQVYFQPLLSSRIVTYTNQLKPLLYLSIAFNQETMSQEQTMKIKNQIVKQICIKLFYQKVDHQIHFSVIDNQLGVGNSGRIYFRSILQKATNLEELMCQTKKNCVLDVPLPKLVQTFSIQYRISPIVFCQIVTV